jgi:hypothetical protein
LARGQGSPVLAPRLDRNDGPTPRSAAATPDPLFEIEHLGLRAEAEPEQKVGPQQRDVMASGAIDLDEIATPEILDPRQVQGLHSDLCSWNVRGMLARFVDQCGDLAPNVRPPRQFLRFTFSREPRD